MNVSERLKAHCAGKEGAWEDHPWGDFVYKVGKKLFVGLGEGEPASITVKAAPDELDGLLTLPFIERAAYVGRFGWITVTVSEEEQLELALDLIDVSYELVRGKSKRAWPN
jgi:predicted DNA-binding protein (MmcQ/YjbR family)